MKLLLDTCAFLWLVRDDPRLSATARELFRDPANEAYLSVVSAWEIAVKHRLGKLPLADAPEYYVPRERVRHAIAPLALNEEEALLQHKLPPVHADPFDRLLVCQAIAGHMVLLSNDPLIQQYPVLTRW